MLDTYFTGESLLFTIPALVGTGAFLIKLGLLAIGGLDADVDVDADVDLDIDADLDLDADHTDALGHGDSTSAFTYFSLQGIAALVMGFGWGGLVGLLTFEWSLATSAIAGIVFGGVLMWLATWLMSAAMKLQSSGNVHLRDALGVEGVVYANIPAAGDGRGQVRVVIGDRARICNAVTEGEALASQTRVSVTKVNRDRSLTVAKI
jgi:hypothetical protein